MNEECYEILKKFPHISFRKMWTIDDKTQYLLGSCDAIVEALRYLPLSPSIRNEMLKVSMIKGALATTAIEGNTLTEAEARAIQDGNSNIPQSRKYLEQEVKNVLDALNMIYEAVVRHHSISPVTVDLIRNFNAQVGKNLGEAFESVPGEFRPCEVVVGAYRPPDHRVVKSLMGRMCDWLMAEFSYEKESRPSFSVGVIEAVVAHVYLVWIHPFCDGNGRTARLLEFYLLLRSGIPNTCAHILSNFYNETRAEYYRQLAAAGRTGDLSNFISYAIQGLHDGLRESLYIAQRHQIAASWRNYVYDRISESDFTQNVGRRYAKLLVGMDVFTSYTKEQLTSITPTVSALYGRITPGTINRDLKTLIGLGLVRETEQGLYAADISPLIENLPSARAFVSRQ